MALAPTPIFGLLLVLAEATSLAPATAPPSIAPAIPAQVAAAAPDLSARASLASAHRAFGIATFGAMVVTTWLGYVQYYNRFGLFADASSTPCAEGEPFLGDVHCGDTPWPHMIGALVTTALYTTTFVLSAVMPETPYAEGDSTYARKLRRHRTLRWVHLAGMIAQAILGPLVANPDLLGLDRTDDHRLLQALATVHLVAGITTVTALGWAGWLMVL